MRTRAFLRKLAAPALLLAVHCLAVRAQTTEAEIKARLIGKPLYLRGFWVDDRLKFDADGQPTSNFRTGTFTETGIDVHKVKLSDGVLHLKGQRVGLEFSPNGLRSSTTVPRRVALSGKDYSGFIDIEIQAPPDGDFSKALDSIFAPDLASLVPGMPFYWQYYARKHFLDPAPASAPKPNTVASKEPGVGTSDKLVPVGGSVKKPVVLEQVEPQFSDAARALNFSGMVTVYLWVRSDGRIDHLSIVKPAGLGLDEQALVAVSKYKFKPSTKDGAPVTVDLYVDVNFQIGNGP